MSLNLAKFGALVGVPAMAIMMAFAAQGANDKQTVTPETILARLHSANIDEVALGQLAMKRGESMAVKKYGEDLVREHNSADKKLLVLAKSKKVDLSTTSKGVSENIRTMKENVAYQNLKTLSGKNFDDEFLKTIKDEHKKAIEIIESSEIKDSDVRKYADRQLVALKDHLQRAESLAKD